MANVDILKHQLTGITVLSNLLVTHDTCTREMFEYVILFIDIIMLLTYQNPFTTLMLFRKTHRAQ